MNRISVRYGDMRAVALALLVALPLACKTTEPGSNLRDDTDPNASTAYPGPEGGLSEADNFRLWKSYCAGTESVGDHVDPDYSNADVMKAAQILSKINKESFYLYRDILFFHKTPLPSAASAAGVTQQAHDFLSYLCGEFRDRATMVKAKLDWAKSISYLAPGDGDNVSCKSRNSPLGTGNEPTTPWDPYGSPWQQMCLEDYHAYISFSYQFFDAKKSQIRTSSLELEDGTTASGTLSIGNISKIDRYIPATTICETKYIFSEYVKKGRSFNDTGETNEVVLRRYSDGLKVFAQGCSQEDRDYYYDFRGDSNYKPNSPEGNAMIWFAKTAALQCKSRTEAKPGMTFTNEDCERYFRNPFRMRFSAARAGLAAWLLQSEDFEEKMKENDGTLYSIVQNNIDDPSYMFGDRGPYVFRVGDTFEGRKIHTIGQQGTYFPGYSAAWRKKDLGLTTLSGLSGDELKEFVYRRIRNAVDRHTNWYASGFDSDPKLPNTKRERMMNNQAYSPFVASSYEMNASDGFTACGVTIPCGNRPADFTQRKHWMFVFKVHKDKWYRPEDIAEGRLDIDFDTMWFDETSFGDTDLANHERAWDRLGSPIEDEHAEIIYLHRISNTWQGDPP